MKVLQNIETLPVLLMNYLQSREQKWDSIFSHFPKDRNCDICLRTKITRASCRRLTGKVDLITADYRILSEGCESRNNHRLAVVVQDLATQWQQSYTRKSKSSQDTQKNLMKFLEPTRKLKVIYTDNSVEFVKSCERSFLESFYVKTTQIRNKWDC